MDEARRNIRRSLQWFEKHPEVPSKNRHFAVYAIVSTQIDLGEEDEAIKLIETCEPGASRAMFFENVASSLDKKGKHRVAKETWKRALLDLETAMQKPAESLVRPGTNDDPQLYLIRLATDQIRMGEYDAAMESWNKIKDPSQKSRTIRRLAFVRAEAGDILGATDWASSLNEPFHRTLALTGIAEAVKAKVR